MRALVVGARGFVGRHAALALSNSGFDVVGMGHGAWPSHREWGLKAWSDLHVSVSNLINSGRDVDVVVNCAGSGNVGFSLQNPLEDFEKNVRAAIEILEFVRLHAPKTPVITLSTAGVYGKCETVPTPETAPLKPVSPYGVHKQVSEEIAASYAQHFGLAVTVVRLFSVYGPGLRKQLLWDACQKFDRQEPIFFGTGDEVRDWIYVQDAAELLVTIAKKRWSGLQMLNGGSGIGFTNRQVLEILASELKSKQPPVFSGESRAGDPDKYVAEISRAKALGWSPKTDIAIGIRAYAEWFRKKGSETT